MFADAPESFIDGLAMSVTTETFVPGQLIISKDEEADSMFFIMRGTVEVISTDGVAFAEMTNGQFFGEVGIILSMKRTASIRAKEESFLLKLTKDSLAKVVQLYPMMQQKINEVAEERFALFTKRAHSSPKTTPDQFDIDINQQNLLKLAVFQDIDCVIVSELALMMSRLSFEAGSVIIQCGDAANSMFFLAKGEVEVYSEFGLLIDTATGPTAWFGEVALLEHVPRTATIKARTDCFLYELKKADVMGMLEKYPVIGERIEETARERLQAYLMRNVLA
ncbi:cyclic nucleotide-binding-like protein [Polychytrium aggregatum]|uniref:cyclic nucleotide-binding-like protein n=1 Tax=Polychytrium aggregatum TaxID=110093 RepID=UPI0022FE846A|nr:cyclic nucleotide-binding-like protein [Polychytrium aggregatum]KAI9209110.1 cyclic nucleotide-binding-like protein [Polychytrium aggregatum]